MFLHCGGRGVLRSSFSLAWLAEELSRRNKFKLLYLLQTEDLGPVAGGGVYGGGGLACFEAQTWRCDELSARRSMHFKGKCPAQCILRASVQRKRRQAWCDYPRAILPCFATTSLQVAVVEEGYFRERLWSETYFREQQQAESSSHGHVCASRAGFFGLNLFSRQFVFGLNLGSRSFFV